MEKYNQILQAVAQRTYPLQHPEFGGANLIVSSDPNRTGWEGDLVVVHPDAGALAWLVEELKEAYWDQLNYGNKYEFFGRLGEAFQEGLNAGLSVHEILFFALGQYHPSCMDWLTE